MRHFARRHRTGLYLGALAAFASLYLSCASGVAFAQTHDANHAAARAAYDRGVTMLDQKAFAAAARQFALADQLVPNDSVLADAIDSSVAADDAAFGTMLVSRAARSPQNAEVQQAAAHAKEKFHGRAGQVQLRCSEHCDAEVDGKPLDAADERWLTVGPHVIVLTTASYPGYRDEHRVQISSTEAISVAFLAPAKAESVPDTTSSDTTRHGLSPAWFWVGVGVTAVVAGGATLSWLDASHKHDDFTNLHCDNQGSSDCSQRADSGKSALLRTNILIGGAAVSAVATAAIGIFLVDWKPRNREGTGVRASLAVGPGDARAVLVGSF
ncbi:MAG TPA: hypothetical protein VNO21_11130 [Polyangiaceae bacterium]|nr:hypothetical protein [Polyangiaceae bacterium]